MNAKIASEEYIFNCFWFSLLCSYKTYETNKLLSVDVVNSLVWTRGKLDVETIRKKFKLLLSENQHLQHLLSLRLDSKLGASVWGASESFTLENHIVESPKMILNCPIVDEPIKELYRMGSNRSILKTCISNCVSTPLDCTAPPWKIHVVSYISREDGIKEKTCLVIRMHVALINNRYVRNALRELFINSAFVYNNAIGPCLDEKSLSSNAIGVPDNKENVNDETGEANSHVPVWSIKWKPFCIGEAITEVYSSLITKIVHSLSICFSNLCILYLSFYTDLLLSTKELESLAYFTTEAVGVSFQAIRIVNYPN